MAIAYMHTLQYLKERKDGTIEMKAGRRFLRDGREVVVNDGCPSEGIFDNEPAQKFDVKSDVVPFI